MYIQCIDSIEQFNELRPNWDAVYTADPHASIFVSWPWLSGLLETMPCKWLVLAARPHDESGYVAFLPLALPVPRRRLTSLGNPLADHTGFVCLPQHQEEALKELAAFLARELEWNQCWMREVMDPRLEQFLGHLSPARFFFRRTQTPCPYLALSGTWEQYLLETLSSKRRKALRRYLRQVEADDRLSITLADEGDLDRRIETVLAFWQARWGEKPQNHLEAFRAIFARCFENESLYLATLWHRQTPIAGMVCFVDRQRQVVSDYIGAYDDRFAELSPGTILRAYSIRFATQMGMSGYDLLRGNESYKYNTFGATDRYNTSVLITRKTLRRAVKDLITWRRRARERA